jgi:propionyl-CoA carboxylase alpha chain
MTIRKLLVANRGEIASRIFRTARAMDIATVTVFSDADAGLPFVRDAGEAVRLPGNAPGQTYLNGDAIIAAAQLTGADAVHPGYGFLSENEGFAAACAKAGLTFVGPSPDAIAAMGSKIAAKELMARAGVPVLPSVTVPAGPATGGGGDPAVGDLASGDLASGDLAGGAHGSGNPADDLGAAAAAIGYPVLVKAAFGGGGRGMRIVAGPADLPEAVASARREAESAFGDGTLFIERFVDSPRHIEVQILGDDTGTVIALFERECSIQRRYQKIIEEAPSPAIDAAQRDRLAAAAVAAGRAIGYSGAGTVEFVLDASGEFYFLEVNTRLQVEHPVTELITGLDLVELQLRIAQGEPVPPAALNARIGGHAIEARLYAEDVPAGYVPASGTIAAFDIPAGPGIRVDAGYAAGSTVSIHYDSMLAKVIAWAPSRDAARRALASTLARATVHGVVTNRDLLVATLRHPEFASGAIDTAFLTRHPPAELIPDEPPPALHLLAAALTGQAERRQAAPVLGTFPSGWRNNPSALQQAAFAGHAVGYRITGAADGRDRVHAEVEGEVLPELIANAITPAGVDLETGGVRRVISVHRAGDVSYVDSVLGHSALAEDPRFADPEAALAAGSLVAPMPGTVVRVEAAAGDHVRAGQAIVSIEAMKMEHAIRAPAAGVLAEVHVAVGDQIDAGTVVAVVEAAGAPADNGPDGPDAQAGAAR